jgi:hypothetical protein
VCSSDLQEVPEALSDKQRESAVEINSEFGLRYASEIENE